VVALVHGDGQRTMLSDRGVNSELDPTDLPVGLWAAGRHLHVSGYVLIDEATRPAALAALRLAAEAGMTRSVDLSPAARRLVASADWCCANLAEGRAVTGADEPDAVAAALLADFTAVALTLGGDGALVAERGRATVRLPAPPAKVVDTTGAGDAVAGTWIARRLAGDATEAALAAALAAAARTVAVPGSYPGT
jgi:sugar/nucleoside kinase (ribokinase family)